jgi:diaminopimelate decarboxylase
MTGSGTAAASLADLLLREHFGVQHGTLSVGGISVRTLAERFGTPLYVYDAAILRARYAALAAAVEGFASVYYSIKANPNPAVAGVFVAAGAGLEIASGAEFLLAKRAGCRPARMLFAGPGKSHAELDLAIRGGIAEVHLESFDEIDLVAGIARDIGRTVPVALRINPAAAAQGGAMRMGGKPAAFGFDEEIMGEAAAAVLGHTSLALSGVHLFAGTQILDPAVLLQQWSYGLDLACRLADHIGGPLHRIDLGGGLGIPYHAGDAALDLTALAQGVPALRERVAGDPRLAGAEVLIEPGRYLAGPAGIYLMAVRSVKMSRGQRFVVADGGMHHQLAASGNLGQVIKRDYPVIAATRIGEATRGETSLVGPLCTPLDTLGRQTGFPDLVPGDLIAVLQSGAYGFSASPVGFLSHPTPAEILVDDGQVRLIRQAGSFERPLMGLEDTEMLLATAAE